MAIPISRGCQSCQDGCWLCIYLTYRCSAGCRFCPAPEKQTDKIVSAFGDDPQQILSWINKGRYSGISFSGGDCFLVFDRFLKWLRFFKAHRPDIYYWAYTNGLEVDEEKLQALAAAGLDELRFNIAATGYDTPHIMAIIGSAVKMIPQVAVEIPSIPVDGERLLRVLPVLEKAGVRYLNLHEYMLLPDDPYAPHAVAGTFLLNKLDRIKYDAYSRANTDRIIEYSTRCSSNLVINHCSLQQKEHQLLQRRRAMGLLFQQPFEQLNDEGLYETFLQTSEYDSSESLKAHLSLPDTLAFYLDRFIHPLEMVNQDPAKMYWRIRSLPPLALGEPRRLVDVQRHILNRWKAHHG